MNELLKSFLEKLPDIVNESPLQLKGLKVDNKYKELNNYILVQDKSKLIGLAVLLQNVDIYLFTEFELLEVLNLPLHYLDSLIIPYNTIGTVLIPNKPKYDTGSFRIYDLLEPEQIAFSTLHLGFAAYNTYSVTNTRELVIALYNKGY
jgi:hypothetical protein